METEKNKKEKKITLIVIFLLIFSLFVLLLSIHAYNRIMEIGKEVQICKDNGYDGAKFIGQFTTEIECSNYTESERLFQNDK